MTKTVKWVPVAGSQLQYGDKVRISHQDGSVIFSEVSATKPHVPHYLFINPPMATFGYPPSAWEEQGFKFERLERVRSLPTESGLYVATSAKSVLDTTRYAYNSETDEWVSDIRGAWMSIKENDVPENLVRLVPDMKVRQSRA